MDTLSADLQMGFQYSLAKAKIGDAVNDSSFEILKVLFHMEALKIALETTPRFLLRLDFSGSQAQKLDNAEYRVNKQVCTPVHHVQSCL